MTNAQPLAVNETFVWRGRWASTAGSDGWELPRPPLQRQLLGATSIAILDPLSFPWEELSVDHLARPTLIVLQDEVTEGIVQRAVGSAQWYLFHTAADRTFRSLDDALEHLPEAAADNALRSEQKSRDHTLLEAIRGEVESIAAEIGAAEVVVRVCGPDAGRWANPIGHMLHAADTALLEGPPIASDVGRWNPPNILIAHVNVSSGEDYLETIQRSWEALNPGSHLLVVAELAITTNESPLGTLFDDVMTVSGGAAALEELRVLRFTGDSYARSVLLRYCSLRVPDEVQPSS